MKSYFGCALWPAEVFDDGARKEDIQAAIQAAWLADNLALGTEIAKRYGVYGRVCLRCATGGCPILAPNANRPAALLFHLCDLCTDHEIGHARSICDSIPAARNAQQVLNICHPDKPPLPVDGYVGPATLARLWNKPWP